MNFVFSVFRRSPLVSFVVLTFAVGILVLSQYGETTFALRLVPTDRAESAIS